MKDLKERILAAAAVTPSLSRRRTLQLRTILIASSALAMATVYWVFVTSIFGWQQVSRSFVLVAGTSLGAAAVAGLAIALPILRGPTMLGRSRRLLLLSTVCAPVALMAWKIAWSTVFGNLDESPRLGYRCLLLSMSMGAVPIVLLALTRRGQEPRHPGLLGAAIGIAVGACGWVLVDLWCPVAGVRHLLRGHILPVLLLGLLGAAIGRVVMSVRARA